MKYFISYIPVNLLNVIAIFSSSFCYIRPVNAYCCWLIKFQKFFNNRLLILFVVLSAIEQFYMLGFF